MRLLNSITLIVTFLTASSSALADDFTTLRPGDIVVTQTGIAVGNSVADGSVWHVDPDSAQLAVAPPPRQLATSLAWYDPWAAIGDKDGNVWVTDTGPTCGTGQAAAGDGRLVRIAPDGSGTVVSTGGLLFDPISIAIGAEGNLLVLTTRLEGTSCRLHLASSSPSDLVLVNAQTGAQTLVHSSLPASAQSISIDAMGRVLLLTATALVEIVPSSSSPATASVISLTGLPGVATGGLAIEPSGDVLYTGTSTSIVLNRYNQSESGVAAITGISGQYKTSGQLSPIALDTNGDIVTTWSSSDRTGIGVWNHETQIFLGSLDLGADLAPVQTRGFAVVPADPMNGHSWSPVLHNPFDIPNSPDLLGDGSVEYRYRITATEVTNRQYAAFLNTADPTGFNRYDYWDPRMQTEIFGAITRDTSVEVGQRYLVNKFRAGLPVNYVSWDDAAAYVNWLERGKPGDGLSTRAGTYALDEDRAFNDLARFRLPTEDEWYKAAFYDPIDPGADDFTFPDYWTLPMQTNGPAVSVSCNPPGTPINAGPVSANFNNGCTWLGPSGFLAHVGTSGPPSHYGTFDQGGNALEWLNDVGDTANERLQRGGAFDTIEAAMFVAFFGLPNHVSKPATEASERVGFRVVEYVDADGDGIEAEQDDCPGRRMHEQVDFHGLLSEGPDGQDDVCQCGDTAFVDGSLLEDIVKHIRFEEGLAFSGIFEPSLSSVRPGIAEGRRLRYELAGFHDPDLLQVCPWAVSETCGDGICSPNERDRDCPQDCGCSAISTCSGQAPGGCYCDSACEEGGDCCIDACPTCGYGTECRDFGGR